MNSSAHIELAQSQCMNSSAHVELAQSTPGRNNTLSIYLHTFNVIAIQINFDMNIIKIHIIKILFHTLCFHHRFFPVTDLKRLHI